MLVQVGSRDEAAGFTGVSHWVEHMNFKGTTNIPREKVKGIIEEFGGSWNGYTWIDQTTYLETASRDALDRMLFIEAERMANGLYEPDECESERTVIISELEGGENDPDQLLEMEVNAAAFKAHPYGHPTIGWLSDLERMTRDDLYGYYRRHYVPNNATLVVVGDVDPDEVIRRATHHFGAIPPGTLPARALSVEPAQLGERRVTVEKPGTTAYLKIAHHAPAVTDDAFFPLLIADAVLTGAKGLNLWSSFRTPPPQRSARLYRALVEGRLASAVSGGLLPTADPYLYTRVDHRARGGRTRSRGARRSGGDRPARARRRDGRGAGQGDQPAEGAPGVRERQRHEHRAPVRVLRDHRLGRPVAVGGGPNPRGDARPGGGGGGAACSRPPTGRSAGSGRHDRVLTAPGPADGEEGRR